MQHFPPYSKDEEYKRFPPHFQRHKTPLWWLDNEELNAQEEILNFENFSIIMTKEFNPVFADFKRLHVVLLGHLM